MVFVVVYDANILYGNTVRDVMIRLARACVQSIADSRGNPPEIAGDVLDGLERAGLVESVAALRDGRQGW
jgi:hypothetical protein